MRLQNADFTLGQSEAQALHVAALEYLRANDVSICGEIVTGNYAPNSQLDITVRQVIRLNRYLLGGKHYNNRVSYDHGVATIRGAAA